MDDCSVNGDAPKLSMRSISKSYPGVNALDRVDLDLYPGEILGLVGENGAGKSTLIKALAGAIEIDSGQILIDGESQRLGSPLEARNQGIAIIHQEMSLIPSLRVWENMFLSARGWVNSRDEIAQTKRFVKLLGVEIDPNRICRDLSVGEQQVVEIASALRIESQILVLDEPTTALSAREAERLRRVLFNLREKGMAIIYISHRLDEILEWTDRIHVLRDGRTQDILPTGNLDRIDLIRSMVGEDLVGEFPSRGQSTGPIRLVASKLSRAGAVNDISLEVKQGEILAITGLVGSGRSEVLRLLAGVDVPSSGSIFIDGKTVQYHTPREALQHGVCMLPEDRKAEGLFLQRSLRENFALPNLDQFSCGGFIDSSRELQQFRRYADVMKLSSERADRNASTLSGGNQQKLLFARWLCNNCDVILLDEPTRGIDVAARYEIYQLVRMLTENGKAVVMVSSDLSEVMGMADQVLVMKDGKVAGRFDNNQALQQRDIMNVAFGAESSCGIQ